MSASKQALRKLSLTKQTVRKLDQDTLSNVHGGATFLCAATLDCVGTNAYTLNCSNGC